jgi:hypothetical protein
MRGKVLLPMWPNSGEKKAGLQIECVVTAQTQRTTVELLI